jgi:hypothetical protein
MNVFFVLVSNNFRTILNPSLPGSIRSKLPGARVLSSLAAVDCDDSI